MHQNSRLQIQASYFIVGLTVCLLYLVMIPFSIRHADEVIPTGDSFHYATGFFSLMDASSKHYWRTLSSVLVTDWRYWFQPLLVALLSPLLAKEPFALSVFNFFALVMACLSLLGMMEKAKSSQTTALAVSLLPCLLPYLYGYEMNGLFSNSLDCSFALLLVAAVAASLMFFFESRSYSNATVAGIIVGVCIWARGNSLPYVLIGLFPMLLASLYGWRRLNRYFLLWVGLASGMAVWFYRINLPTIRNYYAGAVQGKLFGTYGRWNSFWEYRYAPGEIFVGDGYSSLPFITKTITVIIHAIIITSAIRLLRPHKRTAFANRMNLVCASGLSLFYGTYLFLCAGLQVPFMAFNQAPFLSLIVGLIFCVAALGARESREEATRSGFSTFLLMGLLVLGYGFASLQVRETYQPKRIGVNAREMQNFSLNKMAELSAKGRVVFLWYGIYSPNIVNYYREKNNLEPLELFGFPENTKLWNPDTRVTAQTIQTAITRAIDHADYLILPASVHCYNPSEPYPFYRFASYIYSYLNAQTAPRFRIIEKLAEPSCKLLVLQKVSAAAERSRPNYGSHQ